MFTERRDRVELRMLVHIFFYFIHHPNFEFQQNGSALRGKETLTFRNEMNEMKNMMKALVPTPIPIKAVEERELCFHGHTLLRYAKSRPNGKLIYNSIMNGPYVRRMIPEPGNLVTLCQQMKKGSDIGIQEKKLKFINDWKGLHTDGESIESLTTPTCIRQRLTLSYKISEEQSKRLSDSKKLTTCKNTISASHSMQISNNPFNYPVFHQDQPSPSTYMQQPQPINNNYNPQPSFNQNYMQQPMPNPEDITDPTTAMNMALVLMAKAFKLNYSTPTNNNQRISSNPRNRQIAQPGMNMGQDRQMRMVGANGGNQFNIQNQGVQNVGNQNGIIVVPGITNQNPNGNGNVVAARLRISSIQLQAEEFDLMAAAADLDEIEEVNANCILMANLQQASTSEEQYTDLLEPIPEPHQVQQNDSNVISKISSVRTRGEEQ
ncbi:hypothetical protein Tco_0562547 [Tanacetum coccineum]